MASVEEDLGEGMYALRWSGNRISVSSRAVLTPGQSLILKSEISPEGKPTLVVQGPALPDPGEIVGKIIYGPGNRVKAKEDEAKAHDQAQAEQQRPAGSEVAAGVAKAVPTPLAQPVKSLLGLVLEPLTDLDTEIERLLVEVEEEKDKWQKDAADKKNAQSREGKPSAEESAASSSGAAVKSRDAVRPMPQTQIPLQAQGREPPAAETAPSSRPAPVQDGKTPPAPEAAQPVPPGKTEAPQTSGTTGPAESPGREQPSSAASGSGQSAEKTEQRQPSAAADSSAPEAAQSPSRTPETVLPDRSAPAIDGGSARPEARPASPVETAPPPAASTDNRQPAETRPASPPDSGAARNDVYVKEALTQLVKAAELPLASPSADNQSLGVGNRMPEAIADKAAGILLRAAGLTPDAATMEAARALVDNNVPVDRPTVQALMAITAGVSEEDREAVLKAAARLAAKDIPLAAPLAGGLADVMERKAGVQELMDRAAAALALDPDIPASSARPLVDAARELLQLLHVDLDQADAASALERYISTFGREALGKALALVERATQSALEEHPLLPKIDKAMASILNLLEETLANVEEEANALAGLTPVRPESGGSKQPSSEQAASSTPQPPSAPPAAGNAGQAATPLPAVPAPAPDGMNQAPPPQSAQPPGTPPSVPNVPLAPAGAGPDVPAASVPNAPPAQAPAPGNAAANSPEQTPAATGENKPETRPAPTAPEAEAGAENIPQQPAALSRVPPHINAYRNAPRAFPGLDALNLPPMPKVARLGTPAMEMPSHPMPHPATLQQGQGTAAAGGQNAPATLPASPEQTVPAAPAGQVPAPSPGTTGAQGTPQHPEQAIVITPEQAEPRPAAQADAATAAFTREATQFAEQLAGALGGRVVRDLPADKAVALDKNFSSGEEAQLPQLSEAQKQIRSSILMKLESIFQTPGLNRPEFELLRPLGLLDRFLNTPTPGEKGEKARAEAESVVRDLLSGDPEKAEKTLRELSRRDPVVLKETAARLARMESETMRSEPLLSRLADAAGTIRDLGRQLLAVKAENIAGQNRDPGVMLAEVPFKLNDDTGEGRMQMFYRRSKGKQGGWSSRVILDLNTTGMGPVLGDMRFFGQDMVLNMFVEKQETADFLGKSAEDLIAGLEAKGFRAKPRFMVLPPPPPPPEIHAERPQIAGEDSTAEQAGTGSVGTSRRGRLDVKG